MDVFWRFLSVIVYDSTSSSCGTVSRPFVSHRLCKYLVVSIDVDVVELRSRPVDCDVVLHFAEPTSISKSSSMSLSMSIATSSDGRLGYDGAEAFD